MPACMGIYLMGDLHPAYQTINDAVASLQSHSC
jgi:hypothetical protein